MDLHVLPAHHDNRHAADIFDNVVARVRNVGDVADQLPAPAEYPGLFFVQDRRIAIGLRWQCFIDAAGKHQLAHMRTFLPRSGKGWAALAVASSPPAPRGSSEMDSAA
ncbi:MAG: hypothetical protein WBO29_10925 [Albidovulum sp.]